MSESQPAIMTGDAAIARLAASSDQYAAAILDLTPDQLLEPMTGINDLWSPRDVTAHLIGWNVLMWEGTEQILAGRVPNYYDGVEDDFAAINADSIKRHSATDRIALIMGLHASLSDLRKLLSDLPAEVWTQELTYAEHTVTIAGEIASLIEDYVSHGAEIVRWAAGAGTT